MKFYLETERFVIRNLTTEDVGAEYLSWFKRDDVKDYIYYKVSDDQNELLKLKDYVQEKSSDKSILFLGVFDKIAPHAHIGNIKFEPFDLEERVCVFGILIGNKDWQGKGVGTEAVGETLKAIGDLGMKKVYLGVDKNNQAAIRLYEKLGFARDFANYLGMDENVNICMLKNL